MKYDYFDKMNVSMLKHIPKTKFMYCIGVGNNGINEKKTDPSSQWKQHQSGSRISPFLQITLKQKSSKIKYIMNVI